MPKPESLQAACPRALGVRLLDLSFVLGVCVEDAKLALKHAQLGP